MTVPTNHPDLSLQIVYKATSSLTPAARNARTHSKKQIEQIATSIQLFGFMAPVIVDGDGVIVSGDVTPANSSI